MSAAFDIETISDEATKTEFRHIACRAGSIGRSLHEALGSGRKPIAFQYINESEFNAYAGESDASYLIEMNASVPFFGLLLFYRLLSDPEVLPDLDAGGSIASGMTLPFVIDPSNFNQRADFDIRLNAIRGFAAGTIADVCSTFVVCHEFGHVLCGHVEGIRHHDGDDKVAELLERRSYSQAARDRRLAWEYDADSVGASILFQFVEQLADECKKPSRTQTVFGHSKGHHLEHVLAVTVAALFAFFAYVRGMHSYLSRDASHPDPIVRAHCLKHFLLAFGLQRKDIDIEIFHELMDARLVEMMEAMERTRLFDGRIYGANMIDNINAEQERLESLQKQYRPSCMKWSWFDWS